MNIADAITIIRIVLSPALYAAGFLREEMVFLALFIIGAVTDGLDGFLARRSKKKSGYGHMLDGVADTLFYPSCIFILVFIPELQAYAKFIVGVFIAQIISVLVAWQRGKANAAHLISGKINAVVMCGVVVALLLVGFYPFLVWALVISSFISAADRLRMAL